MVQAKPAESCVLRLQLKRADGGLAPTMIVVSVLVIASRFVVAQKEAAVDGAPLGLGTTNYGRRLLTLFVTGRSTTLT